MPKKLEKCVKAVTKKLKKSKKKTYKDKKTGKKKKTSAWAICTASIYKKQK